MSEPIEPPDPDLDDLTVGELAELDGPAAVVAEALLEWSNERCCSSCHNVGTFLDLLAAEGWRVTKIDPGPPIENLLPPAVD